MAESTSPSAAVASRTRLGTPPPNRSSTNVAARTASASRRDRRSRPRRASRPRPADRSGEDGEQRGEQQDGPAAPDDEPGEGCGHDGLPQAAGGRPDGRWRGRGRGRGRGQRLWQWRGARPARDPGGRLGGRLGGPLRGRGGRHGRARPGRRRCRGPGDRGVRRGGRGGACWSSRNSVSTVTMLRSVATLEEVGASCQGGRASQAPTPSRAAALARVQIRRPRARFVRTGGSSGRESHAAWSRRGASCRTRRGARWVRSAGRTNCTRGRTNCTRDARDARPRGVRAGTSAGRHGCAPSWARAGTSGGRHGLRAGRRDARPPRGSCRTSGGGTDCARDAPACAPSRGSCCDQPSAAGRPPAVGRRPSAVGCQAVRRRARPTRSRRGVGLGELDGARDGPRAADVAQDGPQGGQAIGGVGHAQGRDRGAHRALRLGLGPADLAEHVDRDAQRQRRRAGGVGELARVGHGATWTDPSCHHRQVSSAA